MPRQKLTRKQPKLPGKVGNVQQRGPHDPMHQQGRGEEQLNRDARGRRGQGSKQKP